MPPQEQSLDEGIDALLNEVEKNSQGSPPAPVPMPNQPAPPPATALSRYELSHPQIPQFRALLEAPQGYQPTPRDFWEAVRSQVRPVALSQLSDEGKLEAYQNGYFEGAPLQPGQPEPPSMVEGIKDLFGKAYLSSLSPNSPYKKLMRMHELYSPGIGMTSMRPKFDFKVVDGKVKNVITPGIKPRPWRDEENPENPRFEYQKQYGEAGKILFGLLNTHEPLDKLKDPIGIAIRRAKLPHGLEKDEAARGKAYAAALDYATGSVEAATGEGLVRAMQGGPFVAAGAELLFDKLTLDDDEPDEQWKRAMTLDYVNSKIKFDKINHQYENADELAAFILENPQESLKGALAGIVGGFTPGLEREDLNEILIDKGDLTMESKRLKDLQSGYMEPDPGISFLSEITLDPMNLAGAGAAKLLTAPQRAALAGRIKKTLIEAQGLQNARKSLLSSRHADPASSSHSAFRQTLESTTRQLAEKQKILNDYARNSLTLRMAGRASPDELLKQAAKQLDTTTDVGRAVSGMVNDAATASTKIGALRKAMTKGAYFAPEVAGATIGGAMLGPFGAMAGAAMPTLIKGLRVLSTYPESVALRFMMRAAAEAGEELTEAEAKRRWRNTSRYLGLGTFAGLGTYSIASREEGQGALGELGKIGGTLLGIKFLPQLSKFATTVTRDLRAIGPELIFARGSEDSPFFNRLSLLPSPDEGLIGATRERFNTLTASTGDRLRDKLARPIEPFVTGFKLAGRAETLRPGQFRPGLSGKAPQLSDFSRGAARFLDAKVPELGRTIETLGRFGKTAAAGSSIPATFGYLASGGQVEGAIAGALVSVPFTSVGAGFGMFENFRTKADLYQRKIGDVQYYREHLSRDEKVSFDTLPLDARLAMSGFSLSHPDVIFEGVPHGKVEGMGNYSPSKRTIQYDQDTGAGIIEGVLAHEIGHHIAIHGLNPVINRIMFGNSVTGEVGVYGKYDAEGKIVPNAEFLELREFYLKRLIDTENIKPEDIDLYTGEEGNHLIAGEIFADHAADYLLSGKKIRDNTWRGKIMDQAFEAMTGPGFLRDLILKLNVPMDSKGKFLEAGFFKGKAKRIPELENLIKQYYRDTRGLRAREIEGEKVTDPASGKELRKLSKTGVRPVDDSFDQAFTLKDLEDPKLLQKLNTGGLFKYQVDKSGKPVLDDDGNVKLELDLLGNPKKFTVGELKKRSKIQGDYAAKVLEKYGVEIRYDKDGKPFSDDFSHLDSRAIDELAKGPWHPKQIQALREISSALKEGDGERAGMLLGYFAASKNRKPGPVPFRIRQAVPYGFRLTKDGNVLVVLHDVAQLHKNLEFLKGGHKKLPSKYRNEYKNLFDADDNQVWKDFAQYRRNTAQGRDGQDGLSDDPGRATRKKNFLNALHGALDKEHVQLNPILEGIGYDLASSNKARSPFGGATKTFRLDRIFSTERSGTQASPVNVTRAKRMLMPQMEMDFSPPKQSAPEAKPNFWKIYKIDPKGPKVYDQVADVLIQAGSPWMDGSIVESQAGLLRLNPRKLRQAMTRAHGRWDRGDGKQFMPSDKKGDWLEEVQNELRFLGGGELIPGFKIQDFLNNAERGEYLTSLRDFRKLAQEIENSYEMKPGDVRYDPSDARFEIVANSLAAQDSSKKPMVDKFLKARDSLRELHITAAERNKFRHEGKQFMPAAYHGTPHTFKAEEGAPLGKFKTSQIGTGEGAQAYGHGLYFAGKKQVAEHYRKTLGGRMTYEPEVMEKHGKRLEELQQEARWRNDDVMTMLNKSETTPETIEAFKSRRDEAEEVLFAHMALMRKEGGKYQEGSLYKVELAPKENEYLLWDKPLKDQPKGVREKLEADTQKGLERLSLAVNYNVPLKDPKKVLQRTGAEIYNGLTRQYGGRGSKQEASQFLKEAGIPGIKYLDGSSRSKGKGDYNYVLFDEADVTITEKQFMPASEAGATKGKVAEAAKLWNEKGIESPYFKKWFGKSKVVDENGEPLVVYHGTSDKFTAFDADRYQSINKGDFGEGFYFTPKKGQARLYSQDAIKKTDPEVLALQKEYEAQAKLLGTSTMMAAIDLGLNSPEYKKLQQFENKLDQKLQSINKVNDEIIIDSYLSLENPLIVKSTSASDPFLAQSAKERGHDGIIVKFDNGRIDEIVAFSPEQIKSATGNRGTFDAGDPNILFMPSQGSPMAKAGETVTLPPDALKLFIPASPEVNLADYANRKIFALTTDRLGIGQMATGPKGKKKPIGKEAQGGRGFTQIYNGGGWAFSTKDAADRFITRVKQVAGKDDSALVGLTALADVNHLKSQYGQLAYANALRAAVETGVMTEGKVNRHIRSIMKRILESKAAKAPKGRAREILREIKNFADFEKAVKAKKLNFALADWFYGKAKQKSLPISEAEALEFGLDLKSIARDVADPKLADLEGFGQVVGLLEIFKDQQPVKSDFHYSYPWVVEGKRIGFLKEFMDVGELASTPSIRDKSGKVSAQPLQTVMPEFDRLKSMQFMPTDPKAPKRQPVNRVQPQAQSMPANRFMAPAASAGAKLSERFAPRGGLDTGSAGKVFMPAVMDFYKNWDNKFKSLDKFIEEAEMVGTRWAPKGEGSFYPLGYKTEKDWGGTYDAAYKKKGKSYDRAGEIRQAKENLREEFGKFKRHQVRLEGHAQLVDWATFVDGTGFGFHEQKGIPKQLVDSILVKTKDGKVWAMAIWDDINPGYVTMEGGLARTTAKDSAGRVEQLNRGEMQPLTEESGSHRAVVVIPLETNQALDAINRPIAGAKLSERFR